MERPKLRRKFAAVIALVVAIALSCTFDSSPSSNASEGSSTQVSEQPVSEQGSDGEVPNPDGEPERISDSGGDSGEISTAARTPLAPEQRLAVMRATETFLAGAANGRFADVAPFWQGRTAADLEAFCAGGCNNNSVADAVSAEWGSDGEVTAYQVFVRSGRSYISLRVGETDAGLQLTSDIPEVLATGETRPELSVEDLVAAVTGTGAQITLGWDGFVQTDDRTGSTWRPHSLVGDAGLRRIGSWISTPGAFVSVTDPMFRCEYPPVDPSWQTLTGVAIGQVGGRTVAQLGRVGEPPNDSPLMVDCALSELVKIDPLVVERADGTVIRRLEESQSVVYWQSSPELSTLRRDSGELISGEPVLSPRLDPSGRTVAYRSYTETPGTDVVIIREVITGKLIGQWEFTRPIVDEPLWNGDWLIVTTGPTATFLGPRELTAIQPSSGTQVVARTTAFALALK